MQVFLNIVLDEAVEEKDGGEKVRLGMVVCGRFTAYSCQPGAVLSLTVFTGNPRKLSRHARGIGENRR